MSYLLNKNKLQVINSFLIWILLSFCPIAADLYQQSLINDVLRKLEIEPPHPFINFNPSQNMFIVGKDGVAKIIYILESNHTMEKTLMEKCFSNQATTNPVEYKVEKISFENDRKKCSIEIKALPKFNKDVAVLNLTLGVKMDATTDNKNPSNYLVAKNVEIKQQYDPHPDPHPLVEYKGKKLFLVADTNFYQEQKDSKFKNLLQILGVEFKETFPDGIQMLKPKQEGQYSSSNFDQVIKDANELLAKHPEIHRVFLFWANDDDISMTTTPSEKIKLISVGNSLDINHNIIRYFLASKIQDIKNNYPALIDSVRSFLKNDK